MSVELTDYQRGYVDGFDAPANTAVHLAARQLLLVLHGYATDDGRTSWLDVAEARRALNEVLSKRKVEVCLS